MYCIDCKSIVNLDTHVKVCTCTHCFGHRVANSISVKVYGPCIIFGVKNSTLDSLIGKIWRIVEPDKSVQRFERLIKEFYL